MSKDKAPQSEIAPFDREAAIEECAKVCEHEAEGWRKQNCDPWANAVSACAVSIRALKNAALQNPATARPGISAQPEGPISAASVSASGVKQADALPAVHQGQETEASDFSRSGDKPSEGMDRHGNLTGWRAAVAKACGNCDPTDPAGVEQVVAAYVKFHVEGSASSAPQKPSELPADVLERLDANWRNAVASASDRVHFDVLVFTYWPMIREMLTSSAIAPRDPLGAYAIPSTEEVERTMKDAARYRWLRDKSLGQFNHPICVEQNRVERGMQYIGPLCGKALDKAIDAASVPVDGGSHG